MRILALSLALGAAAARFPVFAWAQFESAVEYRSVATKRANVREKPDKEADILWRMWKFMPVEIIAYRGDWVKVRDLDGDEGWMHEATLSDIPTVMVKTKEARLRKTRGGKVVWILERGYALRVFASRGDWLEVSDLSSAHGWIHKSVVWGSMSAKKAGSRL